MKRFFGLLWLGLLVTSLAHAQQHRYGWKIGVHGGISQYYGDLSARYVDQPAYFDRPIEDLNFVSYGLSLERHLTRGLGLRLMGTKNQFRASDRRYDDSPNFARALNVQTDVWDLSLLGTWYWDTDKLLGKRAFLSPYLVFGVGASYFTARGDLLNAEGGRYYYWADNSIRTAEENSPDAASAQIINRDYTYETELAPLQTEGRAYNPITWNAALGLGLKIRLSRRFHLHLEGLVRYTGSDYMDDVAGDYADQYTDDFQAYAANPSAIISDQRGSSPLNNDWYAQGFLSLHYSFGQKTYPIRPVMLYTGAGDSPAASPPVTESNVVPSVTPEVGATKPPVATTTQSDTVRTVVTTTKTIITTTTIDSSRSSAKDSPATPAKASPIPKSSYVPSPEPALDSGFYALLFIEEQDVIDSLFEAQYQQENPPPAWSTTNLPAVDLAPVSTPEVTQVLGDSIQSVAPPMPLAQTDPVAVDTVYRNQLPTPQVDTLMARPAPTLPTEVVGMVRTEQGAPAQSMTKATYDSLAQAYAHQMELERERFKAQLKEQQLRFEYEQRLQQQEQELAQWRNRASVDSVYTQQQEAMRQSYLAELNTEKARTEDANAALKEEQERQRIEEQTQQAAKLSAAQARLEQLEAYLAQAQATPAPDSSAEAMRQNQIQRLTEQTQAQERELEALRQAQKADNATALEQQLADQQQAIAQLQRSLDERGAANPEAQAENQRLRQALDHQQRELEGLRLQLGVQANAPNDNGELERLRQQLATQESELAQLRSAANTPPPTPETRVQAVPVPVPYTRTVTPSDYNPEELNRLRAEEQQLRQRITELEQTREPIPHHDTITVLEVKDQEQQALIQALQTQLAAIQAERSKLSGTLQEFLSRQKPTHVTKIYFDLGKSSLGPQAKETLNTLVEYLREYPNVRFSIKGYASKTGSKTVNQRLSAERAASVSNYLETLGIQRSRMTTAAMGERDAAIVNELDRRSEVHLSF